MLHEWTFSFNPKRNHPCVKDLYCVELRNIHSLKIAQFKVDFNGSQLAKMKSTFLTCPYHEIYREEEVCLKSSSYTLRIMIFVKMWNLGQFLENLIFCQKLLNSSSNLKILLHICDTYKCDYLQQTTFRFYLIDFQLNIYFTSQFCVFYRKIT